METGGPEWTLSDDRKTVTVSFPSDPPVAISIDAAGVDDMLSNLGKMRAAMIPAHPSKWKAGKPRKHMPTQLG